MSEMSFHWLNLSGRNYVVTGAASGIGLAVAQSLVRVGAHVALLDRDRAGAERAARQILAVLESETGRLQNLIHRYINQPSPDLFAEILLLREAVLGTLTTRASNDPMLSGSVERLEQALDRLPTRQRTAIMLRYYEDMTEPEIARALGISIGTVKSTVSRAMAKLRDDLVIAGQSQN